MSATAYRIGFIGAGVVGSVLSEGLTRADYRVDCIYSRSHESATRMAERCVPNASVAQDAQTVADTCNMVFITTPDDAISQITRGISWRNEHRVLHCSGGLSSTCLSPVTKVGGVVGTFHPLQTFVRPDVLLLSNVTVGIEADGQLLEDLKEIAGALNCSWVVLNTLDKTLYHTGAVLACNYTVTLMQQAIELWESIGIDRTRAIRGLTTLLRTTVNNLEEFGVEESLTGPIARGDTGTVSRHLDQISTRAPALENAYRELGLLTLDIARRNESLPTSNTAAMNEILKAN